MPIRPLATAVVKKLVDAGFIAYFAGGWVRDHLMKRPSDDIDIATSASVDEVQALFPKTIPVGVAFGIVIVVQDKHQFEVATFRKDRGYVDGRRPTGIEPATAEEDAERRDFTINGMFYDPLTDQLYDFVGGQKDIARKVIRAIGDPHERFAEDRLRMMRAVRYATRFDFTIDPATRAAIAAHASQLLPAVAMERVWQEFKKMSQFAHFGTGLVMLHELGLLPTIFPKLQNTSVQEIQSRVRVIEHFPKNVPTIAELLELFPSYSLDDLMQLCDYLKLSKEERDFVAHFFHAKNLLNMPEEWLAKLELIEWAKFYASSYAEILLQITAAHYEATKKEAFLIQHARRQELLKEAIHRIQKKDPIVKAQHLMQEGIAPGKKMGLLLQEAERIAVNQSLDDQQKILTLLKKSPLWNS